MKHLLIIVLSTLFIQGISQTNSRKILSPDDFAGWKTLSGQQISNNGEYILYEQNPQQGDGMLIITDGKKTDTIPRGSQAMFGPENDFAAFRIKPAFEEVRKAKIKKVKSEEMPADSFGIWVFANDTVIRYPQAKSFTVPERNAKWIPVLLKRVDVQADTTQKTDNLKGKKTKKQPGDNLVLFCIQNSDTVMYRNVTEYFQSKEGEAIFFVSQTEDSVSVRSSLFRFNTVTNSLRELFGAEGWIKGVTASEDAQRYAFLLSDDTIPEKEYSLYLGTGEGVPQMIVNSYSQGIPIGWSPSENGRIYFSENGMKLFFGTAKIPEPAAKDTLPDDEKPVLDVWSWKDLKLQPQQKKELEKEKKRTWLAVWDITKNKMTQLADLEVEEISTIQKGNGNTGLGRDDTPYIREMSWTGVSSADYYLVEFESGIKRQVLRGKSYVRLSPQGKYILWYEPSDSSFYVKSTDVNQQDTISLTAIIPVSFVNEEHDTPSDPLPYGVAGWGPDDRFVYIYDRYDIWKFDPAGERVPVNITKAFGRRNKTRFRIVQLDKEQEFLPLNELVLLSAIDEKTMAQGYFNTRLSEIRDPSLLIMENRAFDGIQKAKDTDRIIFTRQSVSEFPDLRSSDLNFSHIKKISAANPQQEEYVWSTVRLVSWNSFSGEELKGLLYFPDNLDPGQKYPMIVYYYERNSEGLHRHQHPYPSHSTINKTFYNSNGYLVFVPDIIYRDGYPGQSAYDAIVSGTQYLIDRYLFVDKDRIGLQGQSWGGYQTAWLITRTDMYAAAMAGAPVSNMTSAYGGIRWETGLSRMFQYERQQSRIGGSLWEKPLHYIENSPLFYAPRVNTPLLMMHNDNDGAVPWYQGIEFFVALRRLNKPVWMLTYNNEPHNLKPSSWANRMDLSIRMMQFFDHYLKGKPAPPWMEKGIPATDKGIKLNY